MGSPRCLWLVFKLDAAWAVCPVEDETDETALTILAELVDELILSFAPSHPRPACTTRFADDTSSTSTGVLRSSERNRSTPSSSRSTRKARTQGRAPAWNPGERKLSPVDIYYDDR